MRHILLLLLAASLAGSGQVEDPNRAVRVLREWIADAQAHQPGVVDRALLSVAAMSPRDLDTVRRDLKAGLKALSKTVEERNEVLRRGALLHTDLALLLPEQAAAYFPLRREADSVVYSADGEYVATAADSAHWWLASTLLGWILPHPSADPFVPLWYRAIAAGFEGAYLFGSASHHMTRALAVLPRDPVLLFYAGALHEACASARIQSIPGTRRALARQIRFPTPQEEWRLAEGLLRDAVDEQGPIEARVRLARVLGKLGRHAEAASMLRAVVPHLRDRRLQYFAALFLGSEEGALGHVEQARDALERAAMLFPTAQSPLLAESEVFRRAGDRAAALDALQRLQALPADPADREDPWRDYFRSFALDADDQLAAVRAWVAKGPS